jgi:hypothetical protein
MKYNLLFTLIAALTFTGVNAQAPSYVPSDGLVGYWPFNGNANDESGNGNDGIENVSVQFAQDRFNNSNSAMQGGTGYFTVTTGFFNFGYNSTFTISLWFTQSQGGGGRIISTENPEGQFRISTYGSGVNAIQLGNSQNYIYDTINDLSWHNYTFIYDAGLAKKIVDGVLEVTTNLNSAEALSYGYPFTIGAKAAPGYDLWNGKIDDIGIWNRALTEQEVQLLYNGCTVTPTAIVGEVTPLNFTTANYFCNDNPGSTFTWEVSNGIISSGQGTNSIVVLWGNEGAGTVSVVETNAEGCDGPTASFNVNVQCSSNISSITGNLSPVVLTSTSYTVNGPADSEYQWTVTNGVITSGQGTTSVNVIWAAEGEGTLSVIETTNTGCESPVVTITTNAVITSVLEEKQSVLSIYPNPVNDQLTIISQQNLLGQNYQLIDAFGRVVMQGVINNSSTTLNTQALSAGVYFLVIDNVVNKIEKLN